LLFQSLDSKKECIGIYADGRIHYDNFPPSLIKTWDYFPFASEGVVEYAKIYCGGLSLTEVCPLHLKDDWTKAQQKLKAFLRSFKEAKICLHENCFFDLVPARFLLEFFYLKNEICEAVFNNYARPENHDFLADVGAVLHEVSSQRLNINKSSLRPFLGTPRARDLWKKLDHSSYINYNLFGAKTGRLTTKKNSFPILTLDKKFRSVIEPTNDWFVELDFNAAELRTLLALCGLEQPVDDLHEWNIENIFRGLGTRQEAKKRVFSWLYNPASQDHLLNRAYDRDLVLQKYWDGAQVKTIYNRTIDADKHHALNYTIQSTTSDLFLDRVATIHSLLKEHSSFVAFFIHDSLVLDVCDSEKQLLREIISLFSNTRLGEYKANVSAGKNFGDMRRIQ